MDSAATYCSWSPSYSYKAKAMGSVPICTRKKTFSDHWLITYNCNTKIVDIRNTDHRWWSEKDDFALWEVHTKKNKKYILNEQNNLLSKKLFSVVCQFVLWPRQLVRQFSMRVLLLVWTIMCYASCSGMNNNVLCKLFWYKQSCTMQTPLTKIILKDDLF